MLRTWRQQGWRAFVSFAAVAFCAAGPAAQGSDEAFEPQTTLSPRVAPQNLSLDAAIDSMVRRGLLADLTTSPATRATRSTPTPITPTPGQTDTPGAWRPNRTATAEPVPQPLGWRSAGQGPALAPPTEAPIGPSLEPPLEPTPELATAPASPSSPEPSLGPALAPPTGTPSEAPADDAFAAPAMPIMEAPSPTLIASRPDEPATSDDPLPEDHLAPIDDLPETPAPANDAPGDPVEPEIGDSDLEGMLLPPGNARNGASAAAPDASSLSGQAMTPVGEPDRIERPDESVSPPSNAESYATPEEIPSRPRRPLNQSQVALRNKVRSVLKYYYDHPLNTGNRSPWEVMHCMLAYEVHSRVLKGGPSGDPITTVGWLCFNQPCKGRTLMYLNGDGAMRAKVGPALQGHHGQLLALLAQARVRADYPMRVEGKDFKVADLIEVEKLTCYPKTELTFKLIGLQRYLELDARWMNDHGMQWDFPTLLREEMAQPVRTAACGGSHRLSGLILTVKKRQRAGLPMDGQYAAAQKFVANYQNYAYRLQNNDGSFSTEWFKGPGAEADIDRRLKTTGHQLEFLLYAASEEQLTYYRTVRAVNYLANIMWANRGRDWEAGPLGHAIHALVLYDRLAFAPYDEATPAGPVTSAGPVGQQQEARILLPHQPSQRRGTRR